MRRAIASLWCAGLLAIGSVATAQINPPVPAPIGPVNPPAQPLPPPEAVPPPGPVPSPLPVPSPEAAPSLGPAGAEPAAEGTSGPEAAGEQSPSPAPTPTQPPIFVDPPFPLVEVGHTFVARINSALGHVDATVADPSIAGAVVDQEGRALSIAGLAPGATTITLRDERGVTRDVMVRVAYAAGSIPNETTLRVTGDPASQTFLREAIADAVARAVTLRLGARVATVFDRLDVHGDLPQDNRRDLDVPVALAGDEYVPVSTLVRVHLENFALPRARPARLLVSDYPERLTANGVLFTATIDRSAAQRFLYYHYNPTGSPSRRILVKMTNPGSTPATVHVIASLSGPGSNEMAVGHNATRNFLIRDRRNEGVVLTIPPNATVNVVNHVLPPNMVVNTLMQLREVEGDPLPLAIVAQDYDAPIDGSVDGSTLLAGGAPHARGVYPVPEFYADYTYYVDAPDLEIPIGQLPLPNLREGQALAGDYGVLTTARVVIVNTSRQPQAVALYANPRGGGATGTFLIDNTIVQAHRLSAFTKYKLWQETIQPGTYRRLRIVTIPEGGSSYPLRMIFAPDDGSVPPGAPGSPVY